MSTAVTTRELEARVERGMAWLDVHMPDWADRIDLEVLAIEHECRCILGQLKGSFYRAEITLDEAVACGFDAQSGVGMYDEYPALTELWRTAVLRRRAEVAGRG